MKKRIVIVGAGYSGTLTAKKLSEKLENKEVDITLVDKNPYHTMLTELHEVAAGRVDESDIKLDLKKIFAGRNVNIHMDTVQEIDYENQCVKGTNSSYTYDYLVISAGSRPNYYGISGAEQYTYSLWSCEAAVRLNERIKDVFRKAQKLTDEKARRKLLSFWVIGAGFSGVEMISELAEYVPVLCEKFGISRDEVTLYNVDGLGRVIPNLTEKLSAKAEKKLRKMGIQIYLNTMVASIGEDYISLKKDDKITTHEAGTIIWTAGTQSEAVVQQASGTLEVVRGRIQVDPYLRSIKDPKVYVVGDDMYFLVKGEERPVPQMVENCEQSADIAAKNIVSQILKNEKLQEYKPHFHGVMVSIGSKDGVANVGLPGHMVSLSGFLAIAAKHFINIIYFIQVLGWNKVYQYIKDEFFMTKNNRSLVGGHFSNRTAGILILPLRIYLGYVWLLAGLGAQSVISGSHPELQVIELLLGVAFIGGLFTTAAAIGAFILQIFMLSAGYMNPGNTWMIFVNIAVMSGAGRILGLDYYISPVLHHWWKNIPFVKKMYLYRD